MVPPLQRPFRIDQNVRDVLDIAHLGVSAPDLEQRVVSRRFGVGRIEEEDAGEACAPTRGQLPVLALDVVDDRGPRPGEQRGDNETHALAGPGGREAEHVLRSVVA
jgi:hypothetical protein